MRLILACILALVHISLHAWPPSLHGSHRSMDAQIHEAKRSDLSFIDDDEALERMIRGGYLVPIPVNDHLMVDYRLDEKWHFVRPWTAHFLLDLARDFHKKFGRKLQVNSAVRTVERQEEIRRQNGNAAAPDGHRRSVHPTGAAIDIGKIGLDEPHILWLSVRLLRLEERGLIEATSERRQLVFHVMVFKRYEHHDAKKKGSR